MYGYGAYQATHMEGWGLSIWWMGAIHTVVMEDMAMVDTVDTKIL